MGPRNEATGGALLPHGGKHFKSQSVTSAPPDLGTMRELLARCVLLISKGDRCPVPERRRLLRDVRRALAGGTE